MPKRKSKESETQAPLDPSERDDVQTDVLPEPGNGEMEHAEPVETPEQAEPPAKVKYQVEGTPRAVQAAARKIANQPVAAPALEFTDAPDEPPDNTDELLADGHNMVIVQRQFPKSVEMADGTKRRCAVKLPDRYACPTTREEIEHDVFDNHGGKKYKCTIHPATTNGEQTILGFFTIDCDADPIFDDAPTAAQQAEQQDIRSSLATSPIDTTMRETDGLAKLRADAERRVERARMLKETREYEREAKRIEDEINDTGKPAAAPSESDEVKKLREQIAEKDRQLAEKKVNDRFDKLENSITSLAASIATLATAKPAPTGEDPTMKFILKKMDNDAAQITTLMTALTTKQAAPVRSPGDDLDTFLNRAEKLKALTGGGGDGKSSRLSDLENRLIDMSFDQLTGGGGDKGEGGGDETEDVAKLAVKEFAPILKSFVDKKMTQEVSATGTAPSPEREQQIREEAARFAVQKIAEQLHAQGIALQSGPDGKLIALTNQKPAGKVVVPPRHPGTKVVSEQRNADGVVKKISIKPTDLTGKPPAPQAEQEPQQEPKKEQGGEVKHGEFPLLGENGATLKILFPIHPGEMRYDRKRAVDFVLNGIRSEIRQQLPQQAAENKEIESYVAADAIEFLDEELLNKLEAIDSGPQLEALLAESGGDPKQIEEIKKAGEDEVVGSFLRRLIKTVQTEWAVEKSKRK